MVRTGRSVDVSETRGSRLLKARDGGTRPGNLPVQLKEFVGRRRELAELSKAVEEHRLVTLLGPVGIGKTRLGLKLAEELWGDFADGAWLIELAHASEPELLAEKVATAMGITQPGVGSICDALRRRQALLLLDNCETILDHLAPVLDRLLTSAPRLRVVATSKKPIGIEYERRYPVPPLELPDAGRGYSPFELGQMDAVALFVSRARLRHADFALDATNGHDVARLVRFLDGLPLALELAAGWAATLSPVELLAYVSDHPQDLVDPDGRPRNPDHANLWEAIGASYAALPAPSQELVRELAVFEGGWSVESMRAVCRSDAAASMLVLRDLIERSFVTVDARPGGPNRFRMLGVIRRYAMTRLCEDGGFEAVAARFAAYFGQLAATASSRLTTRDGPAALQELDVELDNLRALMTLAGIDPELRLRTAVALGTYWLFRGLLAEGRLRLETALRAGSPAARVEALVSLSRLAWSQGELAHAARIGRHAFRAARVTGDRAGEAWALVRMAQAAFDLGQVPSSGCLASRAAGLAEELSDERLSAACALHLGQVALVEQRLDDAEAFLRRAIHLFSRTGRVDQHAIALAVRGRLRLAQGRLDEAETSLIESLSMLRDFRLPKHTVAVVESLAAVSTDRGDRGRAARLFGGAAGLLDRIGARPPRTAPMRQPILDRLDRLQRPEDLQAKEEGRAMDLDETIAYALGDPAPPTDVPEGDEVVAAPLSPQELRVGRLVAEGLTNVQVAKRLHLSARTVEGHIAHACNKLGCNNRVELTREMLRRGLIG